MFNAASKLYFTVAGLALVVGFAYVVFSGDRVGFTVLVMAGVAALALALAAFAFIPREAVRVDALRGAGVAAGDASPAPMHSVDSSDIPRTSSWPMVAALAVALLGIGFATGGGYVAIGAIVALIAAFAWFGQVWREHPSWTQSMTDRINDRFVVPVGLPGTVVVLAGIGVISFSRLLLAVSESAAPLIIIVVAVAVLGGFLLLANGNVGRRALGGLAALCAGLVLAAGVAGALKGEREFHHEEDDSTVRLVAENISFNKKELDLPAATEIKLEFDNEDTGTLHNFALLEKAGGTVLFRGALAYRGKTAYDFTSPKAGIYYFQCDVHPSQMQGTVVVATATSERVPGESRSPASNATTTSTSVR